MHLARLRLRHFRNYARLDVEFSPGLHLLVGCNAQGKTNLLEAIYLLATLRSFRGVGGAQMVRQGERGYFVGAQVVGQGTQEIKMYWSAHERRLTLNGTPVRRLTDYLGTLRAVVFCTEDLQLVKGPARVRRRFLDLLLAQTQPRYLPLLQRYAQALRARNALLRAPALDEATLESFTRQLVALGQELSACRRDLVPRLSPLVRLAYRQIAPDAEEPRLEYHPAVKQDFAVELAQTRARERAYRATLIGPHRDELHLTLDGRAASLFASEGQKRTLAIALKMAQAEYLAGVHGSLPVLLLDDVMGELDPQRRAGLLPLLQRARAAQGQVFMTCTQQSWPSELAADVHLWDVRQGALQPRSGSGLPKLHL